MLWPAAHALAGTISGTVKVNGLRSPENILVYLDKAPQPAADLSNARFTMDQQNLTFIPHVLAVPVGSTISFPNNDKVAHNVFSLSRTKAFNLGSYEPGKSQSIVFDKPGIVELRCDVHAEMLAYIMVMNNLLCRDGSTGPFYHPGHALPGIPRHHRDPGTAGRPIHD